MKVELHHSPRTQFSQFCAGAKACEAKSRMNQCRVPHLLFSAKATCVDKTSLSLRVPKRLAKAFREGVSRITPV